MGYENFSPPASYYEPPDPPMECRQCDGDGFVANEDYYPDNKAMECPRCHGECVEPELDEYDDLRIP